MPEFVAETYTPRDAPGTSAGAPSAGDLARAAEQASGPGAPVQFLGVIAVPEEETCFWLYQAPTADAVRAAMAAAGLRPERVTPAVTLRPPDCAPGPAPSTRHTTRPPAPPPDPESTAPGPHHACPSAPGTGPPDSPAGRHSPPRGQAPPRLSGS